MRLASRRAPDTATLHAAARAVAATAAAVAATPTTQPAVAAVAAVATVAAAPTAVAAGPSHGSSVGTAAVTTAQIPNWHLGGSLPLARWRHVRLA